MTPRHRVLAVLVSAALAGACLVAAPGNAFADSFSVTSTADSGPGTLRQAIIASNSSFGPDEITLDLPAGSTITLASDLAQPNESIDVIATATGITVDGANLARGLSGPAFRLEGFTMTRFSSSGLNERGAAVQSSGPVELVAMTFTNNSAGGSGGAVSVADATLIVRNSTFSDNDSGGDGGAIEFNGFNLPSNALTITGSEFVDNSSAGNGGAIALDNGGNARIASSTFTDNDAPEGGALSGRDANIGLDDVTMSDNDAPVGGAAIKMFIVNGSPTAKPSVLDIDSSTLDGNVTSGVGGAIRATNTTVTIADSTLRGNNAVSGGGMFLDRSTATIDRSTIDTNTASTDGGGVSMSSGSPSSSVVLTNVTASGNAAGGEGGVIAEINGTGSVTIRHSTLVANSATNGGGAIESDGALTIDHTIVHGNTSGSAAPEIVGTVNSMNWSFLGDATATTIGSGNDNQIGVDPQMEALADNGGPTRTRRLSPTSPAANAGDPTFAGAPATDQRGGDRVSNGRIDIGALELNGGAISVTASAATVDEGGSVTFTVSRTGGADGAATAMLTSTGTATNGVDHSNIGAAFTWADGDGTDRTVTVAIIEDIADDVDETIVATLSAIAGAVPGTPATATVTIKNVPTPFVVPVAPARLADTRPNGETIDELVQRIDRLGAGQTLEVDIAGRGGVPDGVPAAVINITSAQPLAAGFFTVFPCDQDRPTTSVLNYVPGQNLANEIIAPLSDAGLVCVFASASSHLIVDVVGYVPTNSPYRATAPSRMLDTREGAETVDGDFSGDGFVAAGSQFELQITGRVGIPQGAAAAVVNITAINPNAGGFITVHPCVDPVPNASSLNHVAGINRANEIIAKLSSTGTICIDNSAGLDLAVDLVGWLPAAASFTPTDPARFVDTRPGATTEDGRLEGFGALSLGQTLRVKIAGRGDVPDVATAAVVNIAAVNPAALGFFTVWNCDGNPPNASSLNFVAGSNGSSEIIAGLNTSGEMCVFTSAATQLLVDVVGYAS